MNPSIARLLDLAQQIQKIPAPSFDEGQRAEFVRDLFIREGLLDVSLDSLGNLYGRLAGRDRISPLIISAHLDTVFPKTVMRSSSRESDRILGPGIGDNSLGVASLVGLLWLIRQRNVTLPGDVWFVANVCEEGLGDLRGMKAVVDRFRQAVRAYLVLEGTALGHVYHRAIGVQRYRVMVRTAGGHSWSDYGQPSAIHEAAVLVTRITSLPLPAAPRTTLNVGLMSGGTGVNVLASEATFELDVRSEKIESLAALVEQVETTIRSARRDGVDVELEIIGKRPAGEIPVDHPLVRLAGDCLSELGLTPTFTSGSTDANVPLSLGYPALVLGVTTGGGAHTLHEYIDLPPVEAGMEQLVRFVERVFRMD
jgi:tripeptide aminopeptidase